MTSPIPIPAPAPAPAPTPTPASLDLDNVQGDILAGLPKKFEAYYFFQIKKSCVDDFRKRLGHLVPLVTTTTQVMHDRGKISYHKKIAKEKKLLKMCGVNIAFSQEGLNMMSITEPIQDTVFKNGMLADAQNLEDPGTTQTQDPGTTPPQVPIGTPAQPTFIPDWDDEFKQKIHGLILITGDCKPTVDKKLAEIKKIFGATIQEVTTIVGKVRPGKNEGHEHFGYLDGVSQPAVLGVDFNQHPGQETVRQGTILLGREGDEVETQRPDGRPLIQPIKRPDWALDGSFLVFRYLSQLVPQFNKFLEAHALPDPNTHTSGSDLLGARLVGRWKNGAPVDLTPESDDPFFTDQTRINNFRYDPLSQERCPFAAHTRKTNPRSDLVTTERHRILRRGIPFGPEVEEDESADRGLLFKAYQSRIDQGFQFIQKLWSNNLGFPPGKNVPQPGLDTIIGQGDDNELVITGANPHKLDEKLDVKRWVKPRGGEYFFSPSISALRDTFAFAQAA